MAFTDRFIKVPIVVFDTNIKEITGNEVTEDSYMKINPMEIVSYRPTWDEGDDERNEIVSITLKSGSSTLIYLTVKEFEKLLNSQQ